MGGGFQMLLGIYLYFHFLEIYREFKIILSNFRHFFVFFIKHFLAIFFFKIGYISLGKLKIHINCLWVAISISCLPVFYFFICLPFYNGSNSIFTIFRHLLKIVKIELWPLIKGQTNEKIKNRQRRIGDTHP